MEDILAIILVLAIVASIVFIVNKLVKKHRLEQEEKARLEKKEESDRYWAQQANTSYESAYTPQKLSTESESDLAYMLESKLITKRQYNAALREKKKTTPTYATPAVQPTPEPTSNLLSDIADIATIVNTVHHWNDHKVDESPRQERSVGVTTSESSWGFDDSDSRKSISSSMDTSSSWSSSSSDSSSSWSSSSDSSPSSDW